MVDSCLIVDHSNPENCENQTEIDKYINQIYVNSLVITQNLNPSLSSDITVFKVV